jgi:serine/threonine-protein kinase
MKYETAVPLGRGAMGEVFKAWDPALHRFVALKYLRRDDPAFIDRLLREARLQARVDHERVCKVYEAGVDQGRPFIAMEYIDGRSLEEEAASLSVREAAALVADVAEAIHAAHETGLIHRDLKPQNVLLEHTADGRRARVVDFGLAREPGGAGLTETGTIVGTPAYMAPEQARGDVRRLDRRTDVYALGAMLYRLLAGRPPFVGNDLDVALQAAHADPLPLRQLAPSVPRDLETVVMTCLEKPPERRYPTAAALATDLRRFLAGEGIVARPPSFAYRWGRRLRRQRALAAVVAVGAAGVVVLVGFALREYGASADRADAALRFGQEGERIESLARQSYLLPLHDVRRERALVRAKMAEVAAEIARRGRGAEGPGRFALGRGSWALAEPEEARVHLERAWAAGYRTREVGYALGRALGELYEAALEEAAALPPAEYETRQRELAASLRDPAVARLSTFRPTAVAAAAQADALVALYEGRYDDALVQARAAASADPASYEAVRLAGDVHAVRAREAARAGRTAEALDDDVQAAAAYGEALTIGRSDPRVHEADCARAVHALELMLTLPTGARRSEAHDAVAAACGAALAADPDRVRPPRWRAQADRLWAASEAAGR